MTYLRPVDVPAGFSPNLLNVRFRPRDAETRPGLTARETVAGLSFTGLTQFIDNLGNKSLIALGSDGVLRYDIGQKGNLAALNGGRQVCDPGSMIRAWTAFGRIFMGFFNDPIATPTGIIRHWDGNVDVIPASPGAGVAADIAASSILASPNGASEGGNTVTIVTTTAHNMVVGQSVVIAGVGVAGYNGTFTILTVPTPTTFTYFDSTSGLAASGGGTATPGAGSIVAGVHQVRIVFEMQYGSLSQAGTAFSWTAGGSKAVVISSIPAGPTGTIARRLLITLAGGSTFYYLAQGAIGSFRIADNTTTSVTLDFTDIQLGDSSGFGADSTFLVNGSWTPVLSHLAPDGPSLGNNASGSVTAADSVDTGSIVAGAHSVVVVFETNKGYLTVPGKAVSWNAAGGKKAVISNIPLGPWYVLARRLLFTVSAGASYFYVSAFRIADNTSTSVEVDFSDISLLQGQNVDYLFRLISPGDTIGVGTYNLRLTAWGGINVLRGANNALGLGFDSGFNTDGSPSGWIRGVIGPTGGVKEFYDCWAGQAWKMTGDGVSSVRGEILLGTFLSTLFALNTPYSLSVRVKGVNTSGTSAGSLVFGLYRLNPATTISSVSIPLNSASLSTSQFTKFTVQITPGLGTVPTDLVLQVSIQGTPASGAGVIIDHIEIYPTNSFQEASVLRFSNAADPETFDGTTGFQQISKDDGQKVMSTVQLRSFYYVLKERSLHVTLDDGVQEPAFWLLRQVDAAVGTGSPNSVDTTEAFIVTASRAGVYIFAGGRPVKVSQEIQTTWESINWQFADTISAIIDAQRKRIYFLVPISPASIPINSLVLDYSEGMGEEEDPGGRKWGFDGWPVALRGLIRFEATDNTQRLYFAGAKIYEHTGTDDDGVAIDSLYDTAFLKAGDRGQDFYGGVALVIEGNGSCQISVRGLDDVIIQLLGSPLNLISGPGKQYELYAGLESERAKIRVESSSLGTSFTLKALIMYAQPWAEARPL